MKEGWEKQEKVKKSGGATWHHLGANSFMCCIVIRAGFIALQKHFHSREATVWFLQEVSDQLHCSSSDTTNTSPTLQHQQQQEKQQQQQQHFVRQFFWGQKREITREVVWLETNWTNGFWSCKQTKVMFTLKLVVVFCKYRQRDGQVVGHKPASRRLKGLFITFGPLRALSRLMHNQCPINSWSISNKPRVPEIHS